MNHTHLRIESVHWDKRNDLASVLSRAIREASSV